MLIKGFTEKSYEEAEELSAFSDKIAFLKQIHGDGIIHAKTPGFLGEGDGLFTQSYDLMIGVRVADCNAILMWDDEEEIIMSLHAGWRGSIKGIVKKGVEIFGKHNIVAEKINVWISPSARVCCYEIGEDLFPKLGEKYIKYVEKRGEHYFLDTVSINIDLLRLCGVSKIEISPVCTICSQEYFSYRRDKTKKRHFAYIMKRRR